MAPPMRRRSASRPSRMATIRTLARCSPTRSWSNAREAESGIVRQAIATLDAGRLKRFRAKWMPVRVKKMRHLCATEVIGCSDDDLAQPRMCRLVVKPSQPDHASFDRFGRTRQSMKNKGVIFDHALGDIQRKHRHQVRCRQNRPSRQEWRTHRWPKNRLQPRRARVVKIGAEMRGRDFKLREVRQLVCRELPCSYCRMPLSVHNDELILQQLPIRKSLALEAGRTNRQIQFASI